VVCQAQSAAVAAEKRQSVFRPILLKLGHHAGSFCFASVVGLLVLESSLPYEPYWVFGVAPSTLYAIYSVVLAQMTSALSKRSMWLLESLTLESLRCILFQGQGHWVQ